MKKESLYSVLVIESEQFVFHLCCAKSGRGGQDEIKGEKPLAAPVDLRDVERHRRGGASQAGRGELREKVIVKKKGCPKDDLPEKPVRSSL